jgi:hypothetical protein
MTRADAAVSRALGVEARHEWEGWLHQQVRRQGSQAPDLPALHVGPGSMDEVLSARIASVAGGGRRVRPTGHGPDE